MDFIEYLQGTNTIGQEQPLDRSFQWIFWGLMSFNLLALAYVRTATPGYITVLVRTGIYNRQLYQNIQEDLRLNSVGSVFLTLAYFNCFAVLMAALVPNSPHSFTWVMLLVAAGVVLVKFMVIRFTGFITESREGLTEHWINHLIYFQIITLVVTPVLCLSHFMAQTVQKNVFIALAVFMGCVVFVREIQSFMRAIRQRVSIVYIILYLCTLELIPLIVLIRVLVR